MIANFKNSDKVIITGADRAEALLVSQLVSGSKEDGKVLTLTEFYDIDGDVNGFALELKNEPNNEPEQESEENEGE